jgi:Holliday junction DNA helicase RuvA
MIGRLSGTLVEARPDHALIDVNGVGYEVAIPLGTFAALPVVGQLATLHIRTVVREDAFLLFGFATPSERAVFDRLISVSRVGPKLALTVLSGLPVPELVSAIVSQNARRLATIPGVGMKLAERLGLELKEKMSDLGLSAAPSSATPSLGAIADDAIDALKNLGYKAQQAEAAVTAAAKELATDDLSALLQAALKRLAR